MLAIRQCSMVFTLTIEALVQHIWFVYILSW